MTSHCCHTPKQQRSSLWHPVYFLYICTSKLTSLLCSVTFCFIHAVSPSADRPKRDVLVKSPTLPKSSQWPLDPFVHFPVLLFLVVSLKRWKLMSHMAVLRTAHLHHESMTSLHLWGDSMGSPGWNAHKGRLCFAISLKVEMDRGSVCGAKLAGLHLGKCDMIIDLLISPEAECQDAYLTQRADNS